MTEAPARRQQELELAVRRGGLLLEKAELLEAGAYREVEAHVGLLEHLEPQPDGGAGVRSLHVQADVARDAIHRRPEEVAGDAARAAGVRRAGRLAVGAAGDANGSGVGHRGRLGEQRVAVEARGEGWQR